VDAQFQSYLRLENEQSTRPEQATSLAHVLADVWDQPEAARAAIRQAFDDPANQNASSLTGIFLYADLCGDKDLALAALRRAFVDLNKINFEGLWWPFVTDLRTDPRFKDIVREIGLVDYWRVSGNWGDFARPLGRDDFELIR
jgi:hypothetical protein